MIKIRDKKLHFKTYDEYDAYCKGKDIQYCTITVDENISDREYCKRYKGLMINTRTGEMIDYLKELVLKSKLQSRNAVTWNGRPLTYEYLLEIIDEKRNIGFEAGQKKLQSRNAVIGEMSWDKPIEEEVLEYLNGMISGWEKNLILNENLREHKFFGKWLKTNSKRAGALGYIDAYKTVREHIEKEVRLRASIALKTKPKEETND